MRREAAHICASRFELIEIVQTFQRIGTEREFPMKRLMIFVFASVALIAAATVMRGRSPPTELSARTAAMLSSQELHTTVDVNKLPVEDFEDMSLVYSRAHGQPHDGAGNRRLTSGCIPTKID